MRKCVCRVVAEVYEECGEYEEYGEYAEWRAAAAAKRQMETGTDWARLPATRRQNARESP